MAEGYGATSMSTIAARVGGSKATLYHYFKSKEELFDAFVRRFCARLQGQVEAKAPGPQLEPSKLWKSKHCKGAQ